jgi:hypothetical protein
MSSQSTKRSDTVPEDIKGPPTGNGADGAQAHRHALALRVVAAGVIGLIIIGVITGVSLLPALLDLAAPFGVALFVLAFTGGGVLLAAVCLLLRLGRAVSLSTIGVAYLVEVVLERTMAAEPATAVVLFGIFGYQVLPLMVGAVVLHAIHDRRVATHGGGLPPNV